MLEQFRDKIPLPDEKWERFAGRFKQMTVPAKTILLKEGGLSKKLFLVEKGCIRAWFNQEGRDVTAQFFFENQTVASVESFFKRQPSLVSLETVEPSRLRWLHRDDLAPILDEVRTNPALFDLFIAALFERTFDYMKHFLSLIKDTPAERYLHLLNANPQLVQRVPQHYIASYLGITKVHLSRIKGQLARQGRLPV